VELEVLTVRARTLRARRRSGGFTLIETLVAAAILLVLAVGLLPLFIRSIANNALGGELSQKSNHVKTMVEELVQLPFGSPQLAVVAGSDRTTTDYYTLGTLGAPVGSDPTHGWAPAGFAAATDGSRGSVTWERRTRVRNFRIADFEAASAIDPTTGALSGYTPPVPLDSGVNATEIQLIEIQVDLHNFVDPTHNRLDVLAGFNRTVFTTYKSR